MEPAPPTHHPPGESAEELYEDAPCGYLSYLPPDGRIIRANRTFSRWSGYPVEALVGGKRFRDTLSAAGRIIQATRHAPLLQANGAAEAITLEMIRADGSRWPVLLTSVVRPDASGAPALIRSTVFDATAYQRYERGLVAARDRAEAAEAEARQGLAAVQAAERGKQRFLAAMNHEFRTPISIVTGFSEILLADAEAKGGSPERLGHLREIDGAARHLLDLLQDATRFAGLDDLAQALDRRPVELRHMAEAGLRLGGAALETAGITAVWQTAAGPIPLLADPASIAEAVACILREIARRAPRGSEVEITCRSEPGTATIALRCIALDLPDAALEELRAPLEMAEVHNRGLAGAGLAIAVAERIAQLHGGQLRIRHERAGGTGFLIGLPMASEA